MGGVLPTDPPVSFIVVLYIWIFFLQKIAVYIVPKVRVVKPSDETDAVVTTTKCGRLDPVSTVAFKNLQLPGFSIVGIYDGNVIIS